jgi:cytochrome c553
MKPSARSRALQRGLCLWLLACLPTCVAWGQSVELGASLYERGEHRPDSASAPAQLSGRAGADGSWVLRGAAVACANCHGLSAQGGGEGYQRVPALRWPEWSSSDAAVLSAARQRFLRAVRQGIAASGQPLAAAMPRFDISDQAVDALVEHVARLTTDPPLAAVPVFALVRLTGAAAPPLEREVQTAVQRCLQERLGARIRLEVHDADSARQADHLWQQLGQRREVVAAIAPAWRGWQPSAPNPANAALPSLFPLAADPLQDVGPVHWLFGGDQARAVALLQAWHAQTGERSLSVWPGAGAEGDRRWVALESLSLVVAQQTGQRLRFERLASVRAPEGRAALWWAERGAPGVGWWLLPEPVQPLPPEGGRWWMAQPYPGKAMRPLAQRWADATCRTLEAVVIQSPSISRSNWAVQLGATGRLNDGQGWEWRVPEADAAAFGSATGWSVVEFSGGGRARLVAPLVDVGRPLELRP